MRSRGRESLSVSGSLSYPVDYSVIQGKNPFLPVSKYLNNQPPTKAAREKLMPTVHRKGALEVTPYDIFIVIMNTKGLRKPIQ